MAWRVGCLRIITETDLILEEDLTVLCEQIFERRPEDVDKLIRERHHLGVSRLLGITTILGVLVLLGKRAATTSRWQWAAVATVAVLLTMKGVENIFIGHLASPLARFVEASKSLFARIDDAHHIVNEYEAAVRGYTVSATLPPVSRLHSVFIDRAGEELRISLINAIQHGIDIYAALGQSLAALLEGELEKYDVANITDLSCSEVWCPTATEATPAMMKQGVGILQLYQSHILRRLGLAVLLMDDQCCNELTASLRSATNRLGFESDSLGSTTALLARIHLASMEISTSNKTAGTLDGPEQNTPPAAPLQPTLADQAMAIHSAFTRARLCLHDKEFLGRMRRFSLQLASLPDIKDDELKEQHRVLGLDLAKAARLHVDVDRLITFTFPEVSPMDEATSNGVDVFGGSAKGDIPWDDYREIAWGERNGVFEGETKGQDSEDTHAGASALTREERIALQRQRREDEEERRREAMQPLQLMDELREVLTKKKMQSRSQGK